MFTTFLIHTQFKLIHISFYSENGISAHLLKVGAKRRRTKTEMDDFRAEEDAKNEGVNMAAAQNEILK